MNLHYSIPFSSIIFGSRERTVYERIDELAESIRDAGLQCPIILSPLPTDPPTYRLEDGGRRYRALESLGVTELYHANTSVPGKPGFVLKGEPSTDESAWLTELIANLHREQMDWRDEVRLIVKAYHQKKKEFNSRGDELYYKTFGAMIGYTRSDINAAVHLYDVLLSNPELLADCQSIQTAYTKLLEESRKVLAEALVAKTMPTKSGITARPEKSAGLELPASALPDGRPSLTIDLSSRFRLGDSLNLMRDTTRQFDHIICDPDYAISVDRLESNSSNMATGVIQETVAESIDVLKSTITLAHSITRHFFIFWYDLEHHNLLFDHAIRSGWLVQRWPFIWHKTDHRSNGAPLHNFCKNMEYAMICRKPSSTLTCPQMSSIFSHPVGDTPKKFSHPFAKPVEVWTKLISAVAAKGQSMFDPFLGSGSSAVAAIRYGVEAHGGEIQEQHYHNALLNIQKEYATQYGHHTKFI